ISLLLSYSPTAPPTRIYTLSLHDALPISGHRGHVASPRNALDQERLATIAAPFVRRARTRLSSWRSNATTASRLTIRERWMRTRSEEHTSELQSLAYIVCRLLLEKKK